MLAASQQTAQVTLTARVDVTSLVDFREQFRTQDDGSANLVPRFGDLFIKLSAAALLRHQPVLQQWTDAGIVIPEGIHIAIAIDTPAGLLAPVLRNVPTLPLSEITRQVGDFARRATQRQLIPDELRGGTFTVTNLGRYRVDTFTPILNAPQTAILGVGQIVREPTVVGEAVAIRSRVSLNLTFDHRVVDGATAADFLTTLGNFVERPAPWLVT